MSWEKVGKSLVGLLLLAVVGAGFYAGLSNDDRLQARLTYAHLTYPGQFNERVTQANDLLKYERLQQRINDIGGASLNHAQVDQLVDLAQAPYLQLFARPFEAGLVDHRTGLLIELHNHRQSAVKAVHVRLPAKGLVQIRDGEGNDTLIQAPTNSVQIPSLDAGAEAKVWVYFDADYSQIRQGGISIRHAEGGADIEVYREFIGLPAWLARHSILLTTLLGALSLAVLGLAYALLARKRSGALGVLGS